MGSSEMGTFSEQNDALQVDIQQDDLERFLIVADRLQVRGLSGEETESDSR